MNIENLVNALSKILPTEGRGSMAGLFQKIRAILLSTPTDPEQTTQKQDVRTVLLSNPADPEPSVTIVETLLIEAINGASDTTTKNTYRLALKIVLVNRGHFTDEIGTLEKLLLTLPHENPACNPDNKNPNYPANDPSLWAFVNKIRLKISNCLDQKATFTTTMEDKFLELLQLLTALKEKYERLGPDPLDECFAKDRERATKLHRFKIDYLKKCMSTLRDNRVLRTSIEHSIWASAIIQTQDDLQHVKSDAFKKDLPVSHDKKNDVIAGIIDMHSTRLTYFSNRSKLLCEPIGYYAENQLMELSAQPVLSARRKKSPYQNMDFEQLKDQATAELSKKRLVDINNFLTAQSLIIQNQTNKEELIKAFDLASQLLENKNPLGHFIEICTLTLTSPPTTKERWNQYFQKLQDIPISACWRSQIAELWFCLSVFFGTRESNFIFYREASIQCARQITDRFGKKADLLSKLQLATLYREVELIASIQKDLQALELNASETTSASSDRVLYPKLCQYYYCKFKSSRSEQKSTSSYLSTTAQYCELIRDDYPFGLECVIQWLQKPTLAEYPVIAEAVVSKYGKKSQNPLHLCETAFRGTAFNRYLMTWGPLYAAALNNRYLSDQTNTWLEQGLKPNDILVKLLSEIRLQLYTVLYHSPILVPGAYHYLNSLDSEIYDVQIQFLESLEADSNTKEFAFCRGRPGLLYAIWAEEAFRANNLYLANLFANKSMLYTHSAKSKKNSLSSDKSPIDSVDSSPRKAIISGDFTNSANHGDGAPDLPRRRKLFSDNPSSKRGSFVAKSPSAQNGEQKTSTSSNILSSVAQPDKDSSPTKKGLSPRLTTPIAPLNLEKLGSQSNITLLQSTGSKCNTENPTTLGYLIKAMILSNTSFKNKTNRSQSDLLTFAEHLKSARETTVLVELYYIKGLIWWCYFDSNFEDIWITEEDKTLFQATYDALSEPRKKKLNFNEQRMREYTAIKLSRSYFIRALKRDERDNNEQFEMYPLAAVAYEKLLWMQIAEFDHGTPLLDNAMRELASFLRECVDVHGHILAGYSYACILQKNTNLFRQDGSLAEMHRTMKKYFDAAERFVMIDPGQKANFERKLGDLNWEEAVINKFGQAINITDYPNRESILAQINTEFEKQDDSTLCIRLLKQVRESWCTEDLREWYSIKNGCAIVDPHPRKIISLSTLQRRFELIIKHEFAQGEKKTLQNRLLTKIGTELCSMRESLFSAVRDSKPDPSTQEKEEDKNNLSNLVQSANNLVEVADLSWVSTNFSSSVKTFFKHRLLNAPEEIPRPTQCVLENLPISINFQSSHFTFTSPTSDTNNQFFCLQVLSSDDAPEALLLLQTRFERALKAYCYSKNVSLNQANPIRKTERGFEVTHLDIAILGIIKFIQGKYQGVNCRDSQITELVGLLKKAESLDHRLWQWEGTLPLLSAFLTAHNTQQMAAVRKAASRVHSASVSSPGPARLAHRFSHLTGEIDGSQTHAVPSRASSRRGSGIFAGPDISPPPVKVALPSTSTPSSPRPDTQQSTSSEKKNGSKKGSVKFKSGTAPEFDSSGDAIPIVRGRSVTSNNPPTPKGGSFTSK